MVVTSAFTRRPPFYLPEHFWYSFQLEAESTPKGRGAAGRISSVEKSSDVIGNQARVVRACSVVSQPTTPPRATNIKLLSYVSFNLGRFRLTRLLRSEDLHFLLLICR
jgi:hypothetical protein